MADGSGVNDPDLGSVLCMFCPDLRFDYNRRNRLPADSSVLFTGDFLFVTPDIAPVCVGHLLVVSIEHHLSIAQAAAVVGPERLTGELREIMRRYERSFGCSPQIFEHGSGFFRSHPGVHDIGCGSCIDHAHIHLLPAGTLDPACVATLLGPSTVLGLEEFAELDPCLPYVLVGSANRHHAYLGPPPSRQLLRWVVAGGVLNSDATWQARHETPGSQRLFMSTLRSALRSDAW